MNARNAWMLRPLAIIAGASVAIGCWRTSSEREARDFERMRHQQRYDAYDGSRFFSNGAVMQPPPAHTVPRDSLGEHALVDGAAQFAISCAPCHGAGGFGGGPIAPNLGERRPPSLRNARVAAMPEAALTTIVTDGIGRMPPLGWQLPPAAREVVIAYVRTLSQRPSTPDTRIDSATAARLRLLDSLEAVGASVEAILHLPRVSR